MAIDNPERSLHALDKAPKDPKGDKAAGKMRPKNKTDKFLKAIRKYASEQKSAMRSEVKQLKTERLKEAEEKAKRDTEQMIRERKEETRSRETVIRAAKTKEGQKQLYIRRREMVESVFEKAAQKLVAYTATEAYAEKLIESARAVAELFGDNDCVLYVNERDLGMAERITPLFGGQAVVEADKTIRIGGIKGSCRSMRIIADETLDSKLEAQREWFIENSALSVL